MSNIFEIIVSYVLISYLLNRLFIWITNPILKRFEHKKKIISIHVFQAAMLVILVLRSNPDPSISGNGEKIISAIFGTFISYFVIRYESNMKSRPFGTPPEVDKPVGIRGFLYFFTFMISAFSPLLQAGRIGNFVSKSEENLPFLKENSDWSNLVSVYWILTGISVSAACYAGLILRSDFRRETVAKVVVIMWAFGPGMSVIIHNIENAFFKKINPEIIGYSEGFSNQMIGMVISAAIWTAYLFNSKRVQNTYPER
jgi:hypothetical protein